MGDDIENESVDQDMNTESMDVSESEENEDLDETEENAEEAPQKRKVYLPGQSLGDDEVLEHDPTAYVMLHEANAGEYITIM